MKCGEAQERIALAVDGRVPPEGLEELARHQETCAPCRDARAETANLEVLLRAVPAPPIPDRVRRGVRTPTTRLWAFVAAAAALVVVWTRGEVPPPLVPPSSVLQDEQVRMEEREADPAQAVAQALAGDATAWSQPVRDWLDQLRRQGYEVFVQEEAELVLRSGRTVFLESIEPEVLEEAVRTGLLRRFGLLYEFDPPARVQVEQILEESRNTRRRG